MTNPILADFPAYQILGLLQGSNIELTQDKGYCRLAVVQLFIKSFPGDKYEWVRGFQIGTDDKTGVFAYGTGSTITNSPRQKTIHVGAELGDIIQIEGTHYRIDPDHNKNIKLTEVGA